MPRRIPERIVTLAKTYFPSVSFASGVIYIFEFAAVVKGRVADARHAVRDRHARQALADEVVAFKKDTDAYLMDIEKK